MTRGNTCILILKRSQLRVFHACKELFYERFFLWPFFLRNVLIYKQLVLQNAYPGWPSGLRWLPHFCRTAHINFVNTHILYPFHFDLTGTALRWVLKLNVDTVRRSTCLSVMDSMGGHNQCPYCLNIEHLREMLGMFAWVVQFCCYQVMLRI